MKIPRLFSGILAASLFIVPAFAGDPVGAWKWSLTTPNGEIQTTLTLALKDGKLGGTYSNSFGDTAISNVSFKDDALAFTVDREIGGNKFTLKFQGKLDGDAIKGGVELPAMGGNEARKMDWNAKRVVPPAAKEKAAGDKV